MIRSSAGRFTAAMAGLLMAASPVASQRSERAFSAPLDVVLVNLDVVVLDAEGRPVTGLSREDFSVWEDGTPVDLSHFAAPPAPGEQASAPVNLVLLLDETRLEPAARRAALTHFRRLLEAPPVLGLRVMTLTMKPGLEVVGPLTDDLAEVARALQAMEGSRTISAEAQERSRLLREMQVAASEVASQGPQEQYGRPAPRSARPLEANDYASGVAQGFLHEIQNYARTAGERQRSSLDVLGRLLRSLSGVQGRTALLVASDGLATNPGEPLVRAWEQLFHNIIQSVAIQPRAALLEVDLTDAVRELVRLATAHRVSVFELRAGSGRQLDSVQAETKGLAFGSGFGSDGSFADAPALALLATATGGRSLAIGSRTLDRDLAAVAGEIAAGYSLGFVPNQPRDGRFHTLRVELSDAGLTARHREGFMAAADADVLVDRTLAAAVLAVADDPIGIEVSTDPAAVRDDGRLLLPLTVRIPLRRLGLTAHGAAHEGRVVIALAVRGADGQVSGLERREFPVAVANSEFPSALGRSVEVLFNLVVEPGDLRIGVGVHDSYGEASATSVVDVTAAPTAG